MFISASLAYMLGPVDQTVDPLYGLGLHHQYSKRGSVCTVYVCIHVFVSVCVCVYIRMCV